MKNYKIKWQTISKSPIQGLFDIVCHFISDSQIQVIYKMFLLTTTKVNAFMMIHPSHFGCIKSTILTGLRQMYIDGSCPNLGIVINISGLLVCLSVIDPNEPCCITRCTFLLTHISTRTGEKLKRPTKKFFRVFFFLKTQREKVAMRFEGEKSQDAI